LFPSLSFSACSHLVRILCPVVACMAGAWLLVRDSVSQRRRRDHLSHHDESGGVLGPCWRLPYRNASDQGLALTQAVLRLRRLLIQSTPTAGPMRISSIVVLGGADTACKTA